MAGEDRAVDRRLVCQDDDEREAAELCILRSPFLKLAAVFESTLVELCVPEQDLPAVGDQLITASGRGVVASSCEPDRHPGDDRAACRTWRVVMTFVEGSFEPCQVAYRLGAGKPDRERRAAGVVLSSAPGLPWHGPPSFFLHAGDQIYYDFPWETREPQRAQYRLAYREAWFDDEANRRLLASWPHYMVLDDHEIADQFARDFTPVLAKTAREAYREEATIAYRDYVHARNPAPDEARAGGNPDSFWYRFDVGGARFFILDTRTQRFDHGSPRMIDERQMGALLEWMCDYRHDLKFIVTSVPFVAQIDEEPAGPTRGHVGTNRQQSRRLRSARPRPAIPPTTSGARRASSRSATRSSSTSRGRGSSTSCFSPVTCTAAITPTTRISPKIHQRRRPGVEIRSPRSSFTNWAGGPVNQLQMAEAAAFDKRCTRSALRAVWSTRWHSSNFTAKSMPSCI